jgi:hypothetical protein
MGLGNDLTDVNDLRLRSVIDQASQLVNTYCAVPASPNRHDFRGGTIVGEQHRWPLPTMNFTDQTSRRVYPYHQPLRTITSFAVKFTNTYQVAIDPANLYVDSGAGWAEVVSIAAIVSGVYPVGINFGLYTPIAEVSYTYGWQYPTTGEVLSPTDSSKVFQAQNQFWLVGSTPAVYLNGALQSSGYTADFTEGTVTFATAPTASQTVTLDYTYRLPSAIAVATGLLTARLLSESDLVAAGLGSLNSLRVEEVELRRSYRGGSQTASPIASIDPIAAAYLDSFVYMTVRG